MFADDWLPHISVVCLPEGLRDVDERSLSVQSLDADDYAAAALAALLSPCILLTGNFRHFAPLGVVSSNQGVNTIFATIAVGSARQEVQAVTTAPVIPVVAIGAGTKWVSEKIGPVAWVLLGALIAGGVVFYRNQPEEKREAIRAFAKDAGNLLLEHYSEAVQHVTVAETQLTACVVPSPETRSLESTVLRLLATSNNSLSAQQICDALSGERRPYPSPHFASGYTATNHCCSASLDGVAFDSVLDTQLTTSRLRPEANLSLD